MREQDRSPTEPVEGSGRARHRGGMRREVDQQTADIVEPFGYGGGNWAPPTRPLELAGR